MSVCILYNFFFFNDTATTEIYTLSLHDALPIWPATRVGVGPAREPAARGIRHGGVRVHALPHGGRAVRAARDRKSTRLNSSHSQISYAVFCLKKKKKQNTKPVLPLLCILRVWSS